MAGPWNQLKGENGAVITLSQFNNCYELKHWQLAKRVLRYLQGTKEYGICYCDNGSASLHTFTDASWGNNRDSRSTTGSTCMFYGGAIGWISKKQSVVARSSAEAEYIALSTGVADLVWYDHLLDDVGISSQQPIQVYVDNQSCMKMAERPGHHPLTKHIPIHYHYVRDLVEKAIISLIYLPTGAMVADIFTKPLGTQKFVQFRSALGVLPLQ